MLCCIRIAETGAPSVMTYRPFVRANLRSSGGAIQIWRVHEDIEIVSMASIRIGRAHKWRYRRIVDARSSFILQLEPKNPKTGTEGYRTAVVSEIRHT